MWTVPYVPVQSFATSRVSESKLMNLESFGDDVGSTTWKQATLMTPHPKFHPTYGGASSPPVKIHAKRRRPGQPVGSMGYLLVYVLVDAALTCERPESFIGLGAALGLGKA
jgi:hypothetical protein